MYLSINNEIFILKICCLKIRHYYFSQNYLDQLMKLKYLFIIFYIL